MLRSLNFVLLAFLLCGPSAGWAQGIAFFEGSYEEALRQAKTDNKLVFIDAYAVWCGPCRAMSNQVFPQESVGEFYNAHFVSLKIDMEQAAGRQFGRRYPVSSYPTLLFVDADGELVQRITGAQSAENLVKQGQAALRKTDKSDAFAKRYRAGERDPQLVLDYVSSLNRAGKPSLAVANEFLRDHTDYTDRTVRAIIYEATVQADSRLFALFVEQRAALEADFGEEAVAERIEAAATRTLASSLTYDSDALLATAKRAMADNLPNRAKSFDARADLAMAKDRKDSGLAYKAAKKVVLADGNSPAANHAMAVELYRLFADQPKALALASRFAGSAAKAEPNFDHLFTYAQLLQAQGKGSKAKAQAKQAMRQLAEGEDPRREAMAKELLQRIEG